MTYLPMASIGTILGSLWDICCQVWDFVLGLFSGLYIAISSLLTAIPLVQKLAGYCGDFLGASVILFLMTFLIKFLIGR